MRIPSEILVARESKQIRNEGKGIKRSPLPTIAKVRMLSYTGPTQLGTIVNKAATTWRAQHAIFNRTMAKMRVGWGDTSHQQINTRTHTHTQKPTYTKTSVAQRFSKTYRKRRSSGSSYFQVRGHWQYKIRIQPIGHLARPPWLARSCGGHAPPRWWGAVRVRDRRCRGSGFIDRDPDWITQTIIDGRTWSVTAKAAQIAQSLSHEELLTKSRDRTLYTYTYTL